MRPGKRGAAAEDQGEGCGIEDCECVDRTHDVEILLDRRRPNQSEEIGDGPEIVGQFIAQASVPSSCSEACG